MPTVPSRVGARVRKTYDVFPPGLDAETRLGLRGHLEANPILADTTVSIVMPTYNRAAQIGDAIDSVVAQTHTDWELLVIDDGSDDETSAAMVRYAADERIRFVQNGRGGVSSARNAGLELASGSVIAFLDTDNSWDPEFLALMVAELDRSGSPIGYSAMQSRQNGSVVYYRGDRFDLDEMQSGNYVDLNVLCHRRHLVDDGARFDTELRRMVDWDYLLNISRGRDVAFAPFIGATYELHNSEDQISTREPYLYRKVISARHDAGGPSCAHHDARTTIQNLTLDFAVCLSAPRDKRNAWGDHHFGVGLAQALERRGHNTHVYYHDEKVGRKHDVMISLRGLTGHERPPNALHVMWSISHPELLTWDDIDRCDIFFSASFTWPRFLDWVSEKPHHVLPQATDRARFHPHVDRTRNDEVLFVGNSRQEDRPMVTGAAAIGLPLSVYGGGWHDRVPDAMIKGEYLPNEELSRRYASSGLVLNDHWDSMRDF
ncbi:MAG: glycosyltransferase [Ilumatobacter sp.]